MMEYLKILQSAAQELPPVVARLYRASVTMYGYLSAAFYWATVPLRYPAYYAYALASRVISILLSPLWFTWRCFSGAALMVVNFLSALRLLFNFFTCAIIVGLVAALMIHGISRLITMVLSVHPSQQQKTMVKQEAAEPQSQTRRFPPTPSGNRTPQQQQQTPPPLYDDDDLDGDDFYHVEGNDGDGESLAGSATGAAGGRRVLSELGGTTTTSSESAFNNPNASSSRRRGGGRAQSSSSSPALSFGGNDMYTRDWRSLSSNMKSNAGSRRGGSIRSLLAQTIHEESSESDSL
ncbi:hypothetical protein PG985_013867 [Apiospora marii]|uniref:TRP C-terminal domain-containing protein n=1 Tax=Apiospora marii TaxID=335849 RepID=A0ABR1R6R1_9PEZI